MTGRKSRCGDAELREAFDGFVELAQKRGPVTVYAQKTPDRDSGQSAVRLIRAIIVIVFATFFICVMRVGAAARLTNAPPVNGTVVISWNSRGALEIADQVTGPWVTKTNATNPYTNALTTGSRFFRLNQTVDATTLRKKVLCGYQGWFRCPGDGGSQWIHWSRSSSTIASNTLTFEMWPDMSEYTHAYPAPGFTYPGGSQAYLFSSQDAQTVIRQAWYLSSTFGVRLSTNSPSH